MKICHFKVKHYQDNWQTVHLIYFAKVARAAFEGTLMLLSFYIVTTILKETTIYSPIR
jgi:hypothetical protein